MKRLIILNGPAGVGKSTVGTILHHEIKPSFLLSGDDIRHFLNDYHEFPREGRTLRNKVVLGMLDTLLQEDLTVIIVQLHTGDTMLNHYHEIANRHHAQVHEFFLWVNDKDTLLGRFKGRDKGPMRHPNSALTDERVGNYWDEMRSLMHGRNADSTIVTDGQTPEQTAKVILRLI